MQDCLFCKMAGGEVPVEKVYEDDKVLAFWDIKPQAPIHVLVITKNHLENILSFQADDGKLITRVVIAIKEIVAKLKMKDSGFRVVTNAGEDGGQEVKHLHFHILGGRKMRWPPG